MSAQLKPHERRYRYDIRSAYCAGHSEHPGLVIRRLAPDARDFEPNLLVECWLFTSEPIAYPPHFVVDVTRGWNSYYR